MPSEILWEDYPDLEAGRTRYVNSRGEVKDCKVLYSDDVFLRDTRFVDVVARTPREWLEFKRAHILTREEWALRNVTTSEDLQFLKACGIDIGGRMIAPREAASTIKRRVDIAMGDADYSAKLRRADTRLSLTDEDRQFLRDVGIAVSAPRKRQKPAPTPQSSWGDIIVDDGGSVILLRPVTLCGAFWIGENISREGYQPFWPNPLVERRCAANIIEAAIAAGLTVCTAKDLSL